MICPTCRGRQFVPVHGASDDDDLVAMKPCPDCIGGVASCCDAAGSAQPTAICEACEGEGYVRGKDEANPGALVMLPCLECFGTGQKVSSSVQKAAEPPSFVCPRCGAVSYNPNDIRERYCGACHRFADDPDWNARSPEAAYRALAREAYRDDTFPERLCDHCSQLYRGPAVYCSLECAVADA